MKRKKCEIKGLDCKIRRESYGVYLDVTHKRSGLTLYKGLPLFHIKINDLYDFLNDKLNQVDWDIDANKETMKKHMKIGDRVSCAIKAYQDEYWKTSEMDLNEIYDKECKY